MKGKISKGGALLLDRGQGFRYTWCPFASMDQQGNFAECNETCPHFGEPKTVQSINVSTNNYVGDGFSLQICQGRVLYFDEFIDERG